MTKDEKRALTQQDLRDLRSEFVTKAELRSMRAEFIATFVTKGEFNKKFDQVFSILDSIVPELREIRHENFAFHRRFERTDEKLTEHDKRIGRLEPRKGQAA